MSHVLNEVHNTVTVPIFIVIPENEEKTLKILILDYKERSTIKFDQKQTSVKNQFSGLNLTPLLYHVV